MGTFFSRFFDAPGREGLGPGFCLPVPGFARQTKKKAGKSEGGRQDPVGSPSSKQTRQNVRTADYHQLMQLLQALCACDFEEWEKLGKDEKPGAAAKVAVVRSIDDALARFKPGASGTSPSYVICLIGMGDVLEQEEDAKSTQKGAMPVQPALPGMRGFYVFTRAASPPVPSARHSTPNGSPSSSVALPPTQVNVHAYLLTDGLLPEETLSMPPMVLFEPGVLPNAPPFCVTCDPWGREDFSPLQTRHKQACSERGHGATFQALWDARVEGVALSKVYAYLLPATLFGWREFAYCKALFDALHCLLMGKQNPFAVSMFTPLQSGGVVFHHLFQQVINTRVMVAKSFVPEAAQPFFEEAFAQLQCQRAPNTIIVPVVGVPASADDASPPAAIYIITRGSEEDAIAVYLYLLTPGLTSQAAADMLPACCWLQEEDGSITIDAQCIALDAWDNETYCPLEACHQEMLAAHHATLQALFSTLGEHLATTYVYWVPDAPSTDKRRDYMLGLCANLLAMMIAAGVLTTPKQGEPVTQGSLWGECFWTDKQLSWLAASFNATNKTLEPPPLFDEIGCPRNDIEDLSVLSFRQLLWEVLQIPRATFEHLNVECLRYGLALCKHTEWQNNMSAFDGFKLLLRVAQHAAQTHPTIDDDCGECKLIDEEPQALAGFLDSLGRLRGGFSVVRTQLENQQALYQERVDAAVLLFKTFFYEIIKRYVYGFLNERRRTADEVAQRLAIQRRALGVVS